MRFDWLTSNKEKNKDLQFIIPMPKQGKGKKRRESISKPDVIHINQNALNTYIYICFREFFFFFLNMRQSLRTKIIIIIIKLCWEGERYSFILFIFILKKKKNNHLYHLIFVVEELKVNIKIWYIRKSGGEFNIDIKNNR